MRPKITYLEVRKATSEYLEAWGTLGEEDGDLAIYFYYDKRAYNRATRGAPMWWSWGGVDPDDPEEEEAWSNSRGVWLLADEKWFDWLPS